MKRRVLLAGVVTCLTMLILAAVAYAVSINWGASKGIYDESGIGNTLLASGDIVQLIWDKNNDGIASPDATGLPTADDVLLNSSTIGFGAFQPGCFSMNINTSLVGSGSHVYVRAWNSNTFADATHYGNSPAIWTIISDVAFTLDADVFYTDRLKPPPLAVELASFRATSISAKVMLEWETISEAGLLSFDLQRGWGQNGPWERLNVLPIPTATPGSGGNTYTWIDKTAAFGKMYYYQLEGLSPNGVRHVLGATSVRNGGALWMPMLSR